MEYTHMSNNNKKPCDICGELTSIESGEGTPSEGNCCCECGNWVCDSCTDYSYGDSDFTCVYCSGKFEGET